MLRIVRQHRSLRLATVLTFGLAAGVGASLGAEALAQDPAPKPCIAKKFKFKQVEAACKKGGQAEAKSLMKAAVKKAKAAGEDMNCKTCHESLKTFKLKKDAAKKLQKWL